MAAVGRITFGPLSEANGLGVRLEFKGITENAARPPKPQAVAQIHRDIIAAYLDVFPPRSAADGVRIVIERLEMCGYEIRPRGRA